MAGPYATLRLTENVFLQGRTAWGRSSNRVSPFATYVDHFDTERWLVASTLNGRWSFGQWQFRPNATIAYIEHQSASYVDSLGVAIPSIKSSLGQFKVGPEFTYRHSTADGYIVEPRFAVELIYNFSGTTGVLDGVDAGPTGARGKIEIGARTLAPNGVSLDLGISYDGIGSSSYNASRRVASCVRPSIEEPFCCKADDLGDRWVSETSACNVVFALLRERGWG